MAGVLGAGALAGAAREAIGKRSER